MRLAEKTMVVTGGGSGIGEQLVLELLQRGANVAAVDLRQESLDALAKKADVGPRLSLHLANVADRERIAALPDEVIAHHGAVHGLINNAGIIQPFVHLKDLEYDVIQRVLDVNLMGTLYAVKAFVPHFLQQPEAHIANVSSMGGFLPVPGQTVYGAAKAAVKLMSEGLYAELLDTNVGVSVVMPGAIATNITQNSGVETPGGEAAADDPPFQPTSAQDAARIILRGIEQKKLHVLVGKDAKAMFAASRIAPKHATHFIQKQMKSLLEP